MVTPKTVKQTFESMMPGNPLAEYANAHTTAGMMDPANKSVANLEASARAKDKLGISAWSDLANRPNIDPIAEMSKAIAEQKANIEAGLDANGASPSGQTDSGNPVSEMPGIDRDKSLSEVVSEREGTNESGPAENEPGPDSAEDDNDNDNDTRDNNNDL